MPTVNINTNQEQYATGSLTGQVVYATDGEAIGRPSGKQRQLFGTCKSHCSYSYDVHGWLTSVVNGEFQERLYYADGLDGGCWNGNISTMKWKSGVNGLYEGYNRNHGDGDFDSFSWEREYLVFTLLCGRNAPNVIIT